MTVMGVNYSVNYISIFMAILDGFWLFWGHFLESFFFCFCFFAHFFYLNDGNELFIILRQIEGMNDMI